jgi:hypothetical protein
VPGSPFTGSTLLGSLLNEHPACVSIGAATGLTSKADIATYQCSCGRLFRECEFWNGIAARTRELGHPVDVFETRFWNTHLRMSRNRVINGLLVRSLGWDPLNAVRDVVVGGVGGVQAAISQMARNTWSLASAVLERTGKSVFIDTARDHQRPKYLATNPLFDLKVIHLIRDPRGNSASIMKHMGADVATAARSWRHYNVEAARTRRRVPHVPWMSLRYEELCADPPGTLDRISDFLGVDRGKMTKSFGGAGSHIIGNKMRLTGIGEIREDRSWETKLSREELATIAKIAGPASRRLGYDWP